MSFGDGVSQGQRSQRQGPTFLHLPPLSVEEIFLHDHRLHREAYKIEIISRYRAGELVQQIRALLILAGGIFEYLIPRTHI